MRILRVILAVTLIAGLAGCAGKFQSYNGPEVTRIAVFKETRRMYLLNGQEVLKAYDIGLGFAPTGDKKVRGDGKTPEGDYYIDRRNPNSAFYLSLGISYPDRSDVEEAKALGANPGGDIFIHGRPYKNRKGGRDWTAGCIAVTNREMREIYAMVGKGTVISIYP